jgi:hypothetical protein
MFDANKFLSTTFESAGATRTPPIPEGMYLGQILPLEEDCISSGVSAKSQKAWARLELKVDVSNDPAAQALGQKVFPIRGGFFLDLTDAGAIDTSKEANQRLNRLREAVGLNVAGFNPRQLGGRMVKVKVTQRVDSNNPDLIFNDIAGYFPV